MNRMVTGHNVLLRLAVAGIACLTAVSKLSAHAPSAGAAGAGPPRPPPPPKFSPDGKWIAFTGEYDGNPDVYVISAEGGEPRRLTFHPSNDIVLGWTPDGKNILFRSDRFSTNLGRATRLYLVS